MAVTTSHEMSSTMVPSPVTYRSLQPRGADSGLPLLLLLHGGGDSADFLETMAPLFERLWTSGALPPMLVATPSAGRSFYLDRADGSQRWERFLTEEFIAHLGDATGCDVDTVAIAGVSMGGLGALRAAFRRPDRFAVVAAVEPALEQATEWDEVLLRDRVYRDDTVVHEMFGEPVDTDHFRANHPRAIAATNGHLIAASGLDIYLECGDEDLLHLQYGAEALHRQLFNHGIDHEYRLVRGADHLGASLGPRFEDALRFVGRALRPASSPDPGLAMFASFIADQEVTSGYRRIEIVDGAAGPLEVHVHGEGPPVVLLASLGRGASDFDALGARLARAGYQAIAPEPRGIGGSAGTLAGLTMDDLAGDVATVIRWARSGPATVVGHAFGNRVARMTATRHPDLVESVVLLACGGMVAPAPEIGAALVAVFDSDLSATDHLEAVRTAFFAPGNDAAVWANGWHGAVAAAQGGATNSTPVDTWWEAGGVEVLVVQPADDLIAVAANGELIVDALAGRASMVTIPDAGHALLPEQPAAVATAILTWLDHGGRTPGKPVR